MVDNNNNNPDVKVKFEKLSEDELQVVTGGKSGQQGSGPKYIPELYTFFKGDQVIYIDEKGKEHRAQITLIEWDDYTPMCSIVFLDKPGTLKVHPSKLSKFNTP